MTKLLAFILLLFHAVCVFATDTLVWKVSKKNEPTSYLVGTMHVAPKSFRLPENIRQSLNKSKVLVLETDLLDETKIKPADMVQMMPRNALVVHRRSLAPRAKCIVALRNRP
ncbi:MAG: TraB/GumN family protein, partial [Kingella sp. (in: b-proteobacteria)]